MKIRTILRLLVAATAVCGGCTDNISGKGGTVAAPPAAPNNLAGVLQNLGKDVALSWVDASSDETGFRIEVNTAPFGAPPYVGVFFVGANSPAFVYSSPLPNTTYYFRVYAITPSMQSDPSNVISLTSSDFPLPPFYFTALPTGPNTVDVRWYNGPSINGNAVQRSPDGSTWTTFFNNATGANQVVAASDSGLAPDTVYYYRGTASGPFGTSDYTPVVKARTQSTPGGMTTVTSSSGFGYNSSLAFGPSANQNIVSYDSWFATLSMTRGGFPGPYSTFTIDSGQGNGYNGCSTATDSAGNVFVASHLYGNDELRFITNQTGPWVGQTIDSDPYFSFDIVGESPVIKVSPTDQSIHVVYKVETTSAMGDGHLRHAWRDHAIGSAWSVETAVNYEPVMKGHSFAIDNAGQLHIVYASQPGGVGPYMLKHARRLAGGGWTFAIITQLGQPDANSLCVGPSNSLHVAYKDLTTDGLKYATDRTGAWIVEDVHKHTSDNIGLFSSIVYFPTPSADIHISYYEVKFANLFYAGKKGTNGAWNVKLLDSVNDVGRYTSIGTDGTDLYISYYDWTNAKLKIVRNPQD